MGGWVCGCVDIYTIYIYKIYIQYIYIDIYFYIYIHIYIHIVASYTSRTATTAGRANIYNIYI